MYQVNFKYLATLTFFPLLFAIGCKEDGTQHDASGSFEATEIVVSAEAMGRILQMPAEEGSKIDKGGLIAVIDSIQLQLQKEQVNASMEALKQKQNEAGPQLAVIKKQSLAATREWEAAKIQLATLKNEQQRIHKLFKGEAATLQQKDDIDGKVAASEKQLEALHGKIEVLQAQYESTQAAVRIQNRGIISEEGPLQKRESLLEDQLVRTRITAPIQGTILTTYVKEGEWVSPGKAVCKLANLSEMTLRAYITGSQLPVAKLGQKVNVYIEVGEGKEKKYEGVLTWIADKAEFTPKTIQTKDERTQLVYAVKIKVINDGNIKMGMYGEADLSSGK